MSAPRKAIPKAVETRVLVACRRRCCLCWHFKRDDAAKKAGQIAHVDRDHANNEEENLAWLCLAHHEQYDRTSRQAKGLTPAELRHARADLWQHLARPAAPAGSKPAGQPVFKQDGPVAQQLNAARDIVIHPPPAIPFPTTSGEAIQQIEREFGQDLRALGRCYVMPDFQDFNPPDEANSPSLIVSRQPAFQVIDEFIARPNLHEIGQRCLFVLGDAGMGKTVLLLMLAARHFATPPSPERECVLLKLGPDTLERIAAVPNPARTVLLLDSLDEDPAAHGHAGGAEGRLLELLPRLVHFHRIVLTCRSQFFPEYSPHLTTLQGHFVVGPYECPLKYLALFNDAQVEQYLEKRYRPGRLLRRIRSLLLGQEDAKMAEAREAAKSMESLRLRPLAAVAHR
jgi:hypothetical protein